MVFIVILEKVENSNLRIAVICILLTQDLCIICNSLQ